MEIIWEFTSDGVLTRTLNGDEASFLSGQRFGGDDVMADVVVGRNDVAAEERDAELNQARSVGFRAVGHRADDGAVFPAQLVENLGDAVLAGDGQLLFAAG